ncbi:1-(5-phosphoribosyl)-5-[(5-phosphoribosylamino)methylideneamino] imidazole-4-carboxamide isomerase [Oxobacter pfennigii]|uniref:1-(5-phosphoribosyl)-5-[(5-phosphoribosylamino)methylideneamino] imidazole-4-carboxamide isomerase n=1 Tax=Oxobacter pfennigii TaxID=36849 RepID=A0A0P8WB70_9CLOT|nr:1-(5-phosphoribosyl)-5-[(5-phosphoribosylamino)methylideneamino]imidazole-4-carboxamide isomerase [Oxobacter pfennigii]KPU44964.1 1-(5-phosphoribosyl)-5-[(5-phosphoribosylamino)methylideneamino] imidazole-4-carboxamide isomerase [Oxobacter pfennigii]
MIIYPAIDIKDRSCVRLRQGRAEESTVYFDNPVNAGILWAGKGSKTIHVVDLDGAFKGEYVNLDIIKELKYKTGLFVQMGGGIRDKDAVKTILGAGIDRIIIGSAAIKDINFVKWAVENYDDKIAVSIDCMNKRVAYNGWKGISDIFVLDFADSLINAGVKTIIYTDISKDGMLTGPDMEGLKEIRDKTHINIIASGGVTTIEDIKALKNMSIDGAIIGRALYDGNLKIEKALEVATCS